MIIKGFISRAYQLSWSILSPFSDAPCFVLTNGLQYSLIKNILPFLKKYKLYPATDEARMYLKQNNIYYDRLFFPKYLVCSEYLEADRRSYKQYSLLFSALLYKCNPIKIQIFHGVLDKQYTFSYELAHTYDFFLVPGKYGKERLIQSGISKDKIQVAGFSKLDSFLDKNLKKTPESSPRKKARILYAPTWGVISSLPTLLKEIYTLKNQYDFVIKLHPHCEYYYQNLVSELGFEVIKESDVGEIFNSTDLLISDSSSIMFEYLITNKPIIVVDSELWINQMITGNSQKGPEIIFRHLFSKIAQADQLKSSIEKALSTQLTKKHIEKRKEIFEYLFSTHYPVGKNFASLLENFCGMK